MKVPFLEKVGYSLGDGAANLVFQLMMMFQLMFYTDVLGIGAGAAGLVLLGARVFDAFVDPLAGILSDRTSTKWGKYRPWVVGTAVPFARSPTSRQTGASARRRRGPREPTRF